MKKVYAFVLISLLLITSLQHVALANGPPPDTTISITVTNAPDDAAYIDILVDKALPEIDINYKSSPNSNIAKEYPALEKSDLYGYENDGYVSYSLYYKHKDWGDQKGYDMKLSPAGNKFSGAFDTDIHSVKIVLLDGTGKILRVTDKIAFDSSGDNIHSYITPIISYDYIQNKARIQYPIIHDVDFAWLVILLAVFAAIRITVSTGIEVLIALPFKIKPVWVILVVNLITQIIISVGIPWLTTAVPYAISVAVFEVLVYVLEFTAFMLFTREPKWKKVLLYTVTANTASLMIGLLLNALGLFWA